MTNENKHSDESSELSDSSVEEKSKHRNETKTPSRRKHKKSKHSKKKSKKKSSKRKRRRDRSRSRSRSNEKSLDNSKKRHESSPSGKGDVDAKPDRCLLADGLVNQEKGMIVPANQNDSSTNLVIKKDPDAEEDLPACKKEDGLGSEKSDVDKCIEPEYSPSKIVASTLDISVKKKEKESEETVNGNKSEDTVKHRSKSKMRSMSRDSSTHLKRSARSMSEEKRSISIDRKSKSIERLKERSKGERSRERVSRSTERKSRSTRRSRSTERRSRSTGRRSRSKGRRSRERRKKSREIRSIERRSRSNRRKVKEKSRDRRSRSNDRSQRASKEKSKKSMSKERSESRERSKRSLSKNSSKKFLSKNRSKRALSKDISKRSGSKEISDSRSRGSSRDRRGPDRTSRRSRENSRTRQTSNKRSRSKDRRRSRSSERRRFVPRYRNNSRFRWSRSTERRHRSRSRSTGKHRSRSRSKHRSQRSRSRDRYRSRSPRNSGHSNDKARRSRSKSGDPVAASVPVNLTIALGVPTTSVMTTTANTPKPTKSIADFTALCKKLTESGDEDNGEDEEAVEEEKVFHPFNVKPAKEIIIPPVILPPKPVEPARPLEQAFPVSSGNQHKTKEDTNESIVQGVDGSVAAAEQVFQTAAQQEKLDISGLIAKRMEAQNRLQSNPHDYEASLMLQEVQMKLQNWATVNLKPGQFTGESLVSSMIPKESINSGYQAWAKKDMFHNLTPIRGGVGMRLLQKMGWRPGQVLGKRGEGSYEPIALNVKTDRKGLVSFAEPGLKGKGGKGGGKNQVAAQAVQGKHPVSALAELCTKNRWSVPAYNVVHESGPPHKKHFLYQVVVNGNCYQNNIASNNKKLAKAEAAFIALKALGILPANASISL